MQTMITVGIAYPQWLEDVRAVIRHELQQTRPAAEAPALVNDKPLTVREVAELLDITVQTVHERKRRGILPYRKMGSRTYFSRADVLGALTAHQRSDKPGKGSKQHKAA